MFSTIETCATNCRDNDFDVLPVLAKNPIFRSFLPNLLGFILNFMPIITNFPIFRKNLIEYSEFSVYFACNKRSTVCF